MVNNVLVIDNCWNKPPGRPRLLEVIRAGTRAKGTPQKSLGPIFCLAPTTRLPRSPMTSSIESSSERLPSADCDAGLLVKTLRHG